LSKKEVRETPADRRAALRSPIIVREARCIAGMDVFFGYASNISRSGLFISTSVPHKRSAGDVVEIRFTLPGVNRLVACPATVVWTRPYRKDQHHPPGFGLKFLDLPEEDARAIERWVQETRQQPG
jgi:uncharacterized protein (TIGR02266 family)